MFEHKGQPDVREALFSGSGAVRVFNLLGARKMPPFGAVLACTLDPKGHVGAHVQQQMPEIVIGISGKGEALVNKASRSLEAFDVVHLPLGATLEIRNLSDSEPLHYLIVKAGS